MPGNEFRALHEGARAVTNYLGSLKQSLEKWDRNFEDHLRRLRSKEAKTILEVSTELKYFERAVPNLEAMEAKAKVDKSADLEDKNNFENVFKKYPDAWNKVFANFAKKFIPDLPQIKTLAELKSATANTRRRVDKLAVEFVGEPEAPEKVQDTKNKKITMILQDTSFATVSNNLAKTEDNKKPRLRLKSEFKKKFKK